MLGDILINEIQNGLLFLGKHGDVLYPNTCMAVKCLVVSRCSGSSWRSNDVNRLNLERGIGLILALIMLALLSLFAAGLLTAITTETRIADNYRTEAQLLYLTEAGIEDGREALRQGLVVDAFPASFIENKLFIDAAGRDVGRYSLTLIRDNPLTLRSVGVIGNAKKTIEVHLKKTGFPWIPDAITLNEEIPLPDGVDQRLASTDGLERIIQGIVRNATDVYGPACCESIQLGATGSPADYRIVVIDGDCELANAYGYGMLLVRGNLTVSGSFGWNGLILVIGQGVIRASEGATGSISGAVFVSRTRDTDRGFSSPLGSLLEARGSVTFTLPPEAVTIQRSDPDIDLANRRFPYVVTTYREY